MNRLRFTWLGRLLVIAFVILLIFSGLTYLIVRYSDVDRPNRHVDRIADSLPQLRQTVDIEQWIAAMDLCEAELNAIASASLDPDANQSITRMDSLLREVRSAVTLSGDRREIYLAEIEGEVELLRAKLGEYSTGTLRIVSQALGFLFSWPFVILVLALIAINSNLTPASIREWLSPFKSIQLFGAGLELSDEVKFSAEQSIRSYREQVSRNYGLWSQKHQIRSKLKKVVDKCVEKHLGGKLPSGFRATIHVPDLLFDNSLYQLLDYFPNGSGGGRTKSTRFGLIGQVWRRSVSDVRGKVTTDADELIDQWGMNAEEASNAGHGRQSFVAVYLEEKGSPLGIFYMDAVNKYEFGDTYKTEQEDRKKLANDIIATIRQEAKVAGLVDALERIREDLLAKSLLINIHG